MVRRSIAMAALLLFSVACRGGSTTTTSNTESNPAATTTTDPAFLQTAKDYIATVTAPGTPWTGPTSGPAAQPKKLIVYVSSDQRNGGPQGAGDGARDAAQVIGWTYHFSNGLTFGIIRSNPVTAAIVARLPSSMMTLRVGRGLGMVTAADSDI